jgi:predicted permease
MQTLLQDFRYGLRQLRKSPAFSLTVVVTLALGMGANTAIFTLVYSVLLRSLPVGNPAALYRIGDKNDCCVQGGFFEGGDFGMFSYDLYLHLRDSTPEFSELAALQSNGGNPLNVRRGSGVGKPLTGEYVSGNYFTTLGMDSFAGRVLTPADDVGGAAPVAVLSYQSWQADFSSDPSVVGSTFFVKSQPVTIVGITPPRFFGDRVTPNPPALWLPLATEPVIEAKNSILKNNGAAWLYAVGRLKPGTNLPVLQAQLSNSLRNWLTTQPEYASGGESEIPKQHVVLSAAGGGIQSLQQETGYGLKLLMMISALVLLIACANIANLLFARGTARRAEISIRMALGAARARLIRQMLTESVVLACLGGLAGLFIAYLGTRAILSLAFPDSISGAIEASPSLPVLGFAFGLSLLTGIVFGIAPAWVNSHSDPAAGLRGIGRTTRDRSSLPQTSLIVLQAALALVLLAGAGLLTGSLRNLETQDFGLATDNRYVAHIDPAGAGYTADRLSALYQQLERRFAALHVVKSVGLALYSTLEFNNWGEYVFVEGHPSPKPNDPSESSWDRVSANFFQTVGQPVIRGRGFTDQDTATSRYVSVVNEAFVKKFFPREDPIGRHFGTQGPDSSRDLEIVGIVANAKYYNPKGEFRPMYFRPLTQQMKTYKDPGALTGENRSMFINSITLWFSGPQQNVETVIRRTLSSIDPNLTLFNVRSLDYQVSLNFTQERLISRLTILFGVLAVVLASIGLYGVTAYAVGRRTGEIGVRMALGASRGSVISMVLRGALVQIVTGLAIGLAVTLLGGRLLANQLYGIKAGNPLVLAVAVLILAVCAMVAAFIPAQRAASIDPTRALRTE